MGVKARGRPPSAFTVAVNSASPEYLVLLGQGPHVNSDVLTSASESAATIHKTRREILKHYQQEGATTANGLRSDVRKSRLAVITQALNDPRRAQLSASNVAAILSKELGLSPHTLRKDIAEIRKLTGPSS